MKAARLIISGGGTGGHIYPALAIADAFKSRSPGAEILFVGALGRMEMEKVPQAGYPIVGLPVQGIQRRLTLQNLRLPLRLTQSLLKARRLLRLFKPELCVGVGGYASGPLLLMAALEGIPTLIQEQNSYAGLTNKWLARYAKSICVAYEGMEKFFPAEKIMLTGNPVRHEIVMAYNKRQEALAHFGLDSMRQTLLVIGGSLGARTLNESLGAGLHKLLESGHQLIWQTGKGMYEKIKQEAPPSARLHLFDFIGRMDLAYAAADVVISRAGALSVSELCVAAKPAILVPSPHVAEDHQTQNALALVRQQAALLVPDREARTLLIYQALSLLNDAPQQALLSENIEKLAQPQAANKIVDQMLALLQ